jgi:uncharacterized membrane protein
MTQADYGAPAIPTAGRRYPPPARAESAIWSQLTILAAIGLQFTLPNRLDAGPRWVIPSLEAALLVGLSIATPRQLEYHHPGRRRVALMLAAFVSAANIASLYLLSHELFRHATPNGRQLIVSGALIWLTNVLIFGLWYWEVDRGGPGKRAAGQDEAPDFLFPQMTDDRIEPLSWRPQMLDYLYLSLTNAAAFSPTDTLPLTLRVKSLMGVQSIVSLVTLGLIVSRAVNILQ